jgi:hypothetical protein
LPLEGSANAINFSRMYVVYILKELVGFEEVGVGGAEPLTPGQFTTRWSNLITTRDGVRKFYGRDQSKNYYFLFGYYDFFFFFFFATCNELVLFFFFFFQSLVLKYNEELSLKL